MNNIDMMLSIRDMEKWESPEDIKDRQLQQMLHDSGYDSYIEDLYEDLDWEMEE